MTDDKKASDPSKEVNDSTDQTAGASPNPPPSAADSKASDAKTLSKEEQMARYEEALKDEDWGHQPC